MRIFRIISLFAALVLILSVSAFASEPQILSQPQSVFLPAGTEFPYRVSFAVMAQGENLSYQWQIWDSSNGWLTPSGSYYRNSSLPVDVNDTVVNGGRLFRVIVSSSDGSVVSNSVSVSVGAYLMDSIPQMLSWGTTIIDSIFLWIGSACASIIDTPFLLIGVSFFALGAAIAILSRLLSRS